MTLIWSSCLAARWECSEAMREVRPRLLARLAVALHWSDEPRERLRALVSEAIAGADRSHDSELTSFVRAAGSLALYSVESPDESIRESEAVLGEEISTALLKMILRITALWQVGQMRDVDVGIDGLCALLNRARKPSATWYSGMLRATRSLMKGEYAAAHELGEEFLRLGLAVDDRNALHSFALQRAMSGN